MPEGEGDAQYDEHFQDRMDNDNNEMLASDMSDSVIQISNKNSLIWFSIHLGRQELPAMLDSGANPNCISLRCVNGSSYLKRLTKYPYTGKQIVDANGAAIEPSYVIKCKLQIGNPEITVETEFVVIPSLPFSCVIGQQTLRTFDSWEVSKVNKTLILNRCVMYHFVTAML